MTKLTDFAQQSGYQADQLTQFANDYLGVFTTGFHYAFMCAIGAMIISLVIFLANKKKFPGNEPAVQAEKKSADAHPAMSVSEVRQRLYALFAVFAVVIFFWFSSHQNGLTPALFGMGFTRPAAMRPHLGVPSI